MSAIAHRLTSGLKTWALMIGVAMLVSSCSQARSDQPQSQIKIDGSSTVYPITNAIATDFQATQAKTDCCYALQDKVWVTDPDGNQWEIFVVKVGDTALEHNLVTSVTPEMTVANQPCCS
jgi:ABC-type phosphate transport system substrate-binding protein